MFSQAQIRSEGLKFKITPDEEKLIDAVKDNYPFYSLMAQYNNGSDRDKLSILVDIYGGYYRTVFSKDESLYNEYAKNLIDYCKIYNKWIPSTKVKNKIVEEAIVLEKQEIEEKRNQKAIKVQISAEPLLKLQKVFSSYQIHPVAEESLTHFSRDEGIFLYSNDQNHIKTYLTKCYSENKKSSPSKDKNFTLLEYLKKPITYHNLAVIVGNGYLLSLIPDFKEDFFILLDQEPAVHFFMLKLKEIILTCEVIDNFNEMTKQIISKIKDLEKYIYMMKMANPLKKMELNRK
ncbi:MAG: hypothetical protein JO131_02560 [Gammaproteobacteria bacterium]|nr:hypothetical protein [Gammaproteobacteria bacterium]